MQRIKIPRWELGTGIILIAWALVFSGCNALKLVRSPDDKAITTQIQAKLFDDSILKMRDIHVASDKGTVTLTGTVPTQLEKAAAERIAGQAEGVKGIVNELVVSSASTAEPPALTQPKESANSKPPQPPASATSEARAPRATRRHRPVVNSSGEAAPAEEASAPMTPAENPTPMPAQAAPPASVAAAPVPAAAAAPAVKPPEQITIPAGAFFSVRMIDSIDSARSATGDEFAASLATPLRVGDREVIPRNSDARVRLVQAESAGRMSGRSELKVELVSVTVGGRTYPLETDYYEQAGASRSTRTAEAVGGGAVLGALIGAIAGRGRGAAVGSVAGAGTGAAVEARTHGQQVKIPSETRLSFTLKSPVTISMGPGNGSPASTANPNAGPQPSIANPGGAPLPSIPNPGAGSQP